MKDLAIPELPRRTPPRSKLESSLDSTFSDGEIKRQNAGRGISFCVQAKDDPVHELKHREAWKKQKRTGMRNSGPQKIKFTRSGDNFEVGNNQLNLATYRTVCG